ncbi:protein piccolo-like isoform X2 [Anser cygnoides]|uniref:protein piccolo-like isoform X2 n=1 Tax=Anser cygnoides TaxID=8845 RepID=UPI0034D23CD6
MGERLRAPAAKLFGKHEEEEAAGEEKIQSHLQSLRKVLAEFLEWRAADEKRRQDYLGNIPATRPAKPHTRSGPTARIPGRFAPKRKFIRKELKLSPRRSLSKALETSEAERRRVGGEFERLRRLLDEKERGVLRRLAELDAAFEAAQAEKASRLAEEIARLHGLIGQLEAGRLPQLERSEAAASPRAGKEPALLPPPARCPRGGSERTARPREIQTEAGNGENPEHGGKGKTSARGPSARGVPPPGPDNSDGSQPRERLRETSGTKPTCAVCLDFFRWPVMLLAQKLTSLKAQPQKLISLKAQPQKLTSLKARPQKLISLKTRPQKLISLKARPQKLTSLKARPQKLISLKAQPPKLTSLKARPQKLTSLKAQPQILPSHHGAKPSAFPPGIRERKLG